MKKRSHLREDEDVNLERRRNSRVFGHKGRRRCWCAVNTNKLFPQGNLYVLSWLLLLYTNTTARLNVLDMILLLWSVWPAHSPAAFFIWEKQTLQNVWTQFFWCWCLKVAWNIRKNPLPRVVDSTLRRRGFSLHRGTVLDHRRLLVDECSRCTGAWRRNHTHQEP